MTAVQCPVCQHSGSIPDAYTGRKIGCKKCGTKFDGDPLVFDQTPRARRIRWPLWTWVAGLVCGLGLGIYGTITVEGWFAPAVKGTEKATVSAKSPEKSAPSKGQDAKDKDAVIAFIKAHADDPGNLEIIEFGDRTGTERRVVFRCNQVGTTPSDINSRTGQSIGGTGGTAVKRESMTVQFLPNGGMMANLEECFRVW